MMNPNQTDSAPSSPDPHNKRRLLSLFAVIVGVCALIVIATQLFGVFFSRPLTVTFENNTEEEIVSVEFRMANMDIPYTFERSIPAGESRNIRPEFGDLIEGSMSFTAVDAQARHYLGVACGYTSRLAGESVIAIDGQSITVQDECR